MKTRRAALAALAVLLALALLELVLQGFVLPRAWRPLPPFGTLEDAQRRAWLERQERELAGELPPRGYSQFDALLGWAPRPSSESAGGAVHVNSRGLRGSREYAAGIPAGTLRAVACGDSFTFCEEVRDGEAWPAQVEELLPRCEVLNLGVGGYGTDQALLRLERFGLERVDAVIVGLLLENIGRNVNRYRPLWYPSAEPAAKPRYVLRESGLELLPQPFATRAELVAAVRSGEVLARLREHEHWAETFLPPGLSWSAAARLLAARRAYAARELEPLWRDTAGEPFRTTLALLAGFRPVARELGSEHVLVLVFPTRADLRRMLETGQRYWQPLLEALAGQGLEYIDLSGPLGEAERARGPTDPPLYLESHLSPAANRIVASEVARWLAGLLPGLGGY
jgi:hypothetical protein